MDNAIYERLLEYRKKNGLSQEELAEKIGVSRQAISKWERGESSPDTDNLIALSQLYGVTVDELLFGKKAEEKEKAPSSDSVNIGTGGIDIQSAQGDRVHVGFDGIRVTDGDGNPSESLNKYENENKSRPMLSAVIIIIGIIAFLLVGFLFKLWKVCWVLILLAICVSSLIEAIDKKKPSHFNYPLLMVSIYCGIGLTAKIWHPTWILFVTIPIFYLICDAVKKK